jgi:hypothetical protein
MNIPALVALSVVVPSPARNTARLPGVNGAACATENEKQKSAQTPATAVAKPFRVRVGQQTATPDPRIKLLMADTRGRAMVDHGEGHEKNTHRLEREPLFIRRNPG